MKGLVITLIVTTFGAPVAALMGGNAHASTEIKAGWLSTLKTSESFKNYLEGAESGLTWYNLAAKREFGRFLYCPPPKLSLNYENLIYMLEKYIKEHELTPGVYDELPVIALLLDALRENFPCESTK